MNLQEIIKCIKADRSIKELKVDLKSWVRIKRDLEQLNLIRPMPYSQVPVEDRWLWHERKAIMRLAEIRVLGVKIVCEK